jgi:hypothetical protein
MLKLQGKSNAIQNKRLWTVGIVAALCAQATAQGSKDVARPGSGC